MALLGEQAPPEVLIICTFRNAEKTISELVASVCTQTFTGFHCVFVDDASVDGTRALVESLAMKDARISVVSNPRPGRGRALNLGLAAVDTPYVAIIDADDVARDDWLEGSLDAIRSSGFDAVGVGVVLFGDRRSLAWTRPSAHLTKAVDTTSWLGRVNPISHTGAIIARSALCRVGGYDERRASQFDYDLWVRIAASGGRIGRLNEKLVGKRVHEEQSFERRRHVRYAFASSLVQLRAIKRLRRYQDLPWVLARFSWAFLPRRIRIAARGLRIGQGG